MCLYIEARGGDVKLKSGTTIKENGKKWRAMCVSVLKRSDVYGSGVRDDAMQ